MIYWAVENSLAYPQACYTGGIRIINIIMNTQRAILIAFLGNYLINTVVAALVSLIPANGATGLLTPQYITFVMASAILVVILAWWYGARDLKDGAIFGATAFVVAIVTAFVTGISGVLAQTGSFSSVAGVLPNFWPFLWNWTTLALLGYWVIPAALLGWWSSRGMASGSSTSSGSMGSM